MAPELARAARALAGAIRRFVGGPIGWSVLGSAVYGLSQWLMLLVLVRLGSVPDVGRYGLALAVTAPVVIATNLQLRNLIATEQPAATDFGHYVALRWATVVVDVAIVGSILLLFPWDASQVIVVVAVLLAKEIESFSDLCYGVFLRHRRTPLLARAQAIRAVLGPSVFGALLALGQPLPAAVLGVCVAWVAVLALHDVPAASAMTGLARRSWAPRSSQDVPAMVRLARVGLPLGLVSLLVSVTVATPRVILERSATVEAVGIYTALSYLIVGGALLVNASCQAVLPRLAEDFRRGAPRARVYVGGLLAGASVVGLVGLAAAAWAGPSLLEALYGPDYASHGETLLWLMLAGLLTYWASVGSWVLTAWGRHRQQAWTMVVTAGTAVASGLVLIPRAQETGAAQTTVAAMAVQFAISLAILGRSAARREATALVSAPGPR